MTIARLMNHRLNGRVANDTNEDVIRKKVEGQVLYNNGEFAEIQTSGIEGIEDGLLLETIQTQRGDTNDSVDAFQRRFPVGMWLEIITTTEITPALHEQSSNQDFP